MEEIANKYDRCSIERFLAMDCIADERKKNITALMNDESEHQEDQTA